MIPFSIIIITLNEKHYIGNLLSDLEQQTNKRSIHEIIVVDGGSKDDTKGVVLSFAKRLPITFLQAPRRGYSVQKNYGIARATGTGLIFFDADIRVAPGTIARLEQSFLQEPDALFAGYISADSAKLKYRLGAGLTYGYFRTLSMFGKPTASGQCLMMHHKTVQELGGFNPTVPHAEEQELLTRAGQRGMHLRWVRRLHIFASMRRFEEVGAGRLLWRYVISEVHRQVKRGKISKDYVGYTYDSKR